MSRDRIVPVQLLRFLAAFAVLASHAEIFGYYLGRFNGMEPPRYEWIARGGIGVDVFFAISGFVMVLSTASLSGKPGSRRTFMIRRLIRIVPLYWAALAFVVLWGWRFGPVSDLASIAHGFAFIPYASNTANGRIMPPLEVGWTLNYEMLFYTLFALSLAATARATAQRMAMIMIALVALGSVTALPQLFKTWTDPILLEFGGGMALALLYRQQVRLPALVRAAMVIAAVLLLLPSDPLLAASAEWNRLLTWGVAGWLLLAAAVLGPLRLPGSRLCNFGGDMSYALYLVHMPLLIVAQLLWRHFHLPYGAGWEALFCTTTMLLSLIAAAILHVLCERPVTGWLRRQAERLHAK